MARSIVELGIKQYPTTPFFYRLELFIYDLYSILSKTLTIAEWEISTLFIILLCSFLLSIITLLFMTAILFSKQQNLDENAKESFRFLYKFSLIK